MSDTFDQTYADFSASRRAQIMARIEAACARVGRDVSEVSPVAVSKTVGTGELLAAWRAGWRRFAENRPQELTRKLAFVGQTPEMAGAAFDLIGNLQKNKINQVLGRASLIQSISSATLAQAVSKRAEREGLRVPVLLECNVSGEQSKGGFSPDEVREAAEGLAALPGIRIEGVMSMAPAHDRAEARRTFSGARELAEELRGRTGLALPVLSCGMSDDFEIAVEEGSTLVRLGRIVFSADYDLA